MTPQRFPPGWGESRIRDVIAHYDKQTEDERIAEIAAAISRKRGVAQRIAAAVTLQAPRYALGKWLNRKLKVGVYELQGGEIVAGRGRRPEDRIAVNEVRAWQIYGELCFDMVVIELADGRTVRWLDTYNDLIAILRKVAPARERPWTLA